MGWVGPAHDLLADGRSAVLVRVVRVQGSTPREAGAAMLVWSDGSMGTIGGGRLELDAVATAHQRLDLASRRNGPRFEGPVDVALGPAIGQCCGGVAGLLWESLGPADAPWVGRLAEHAGDSEAVAVMGVATGERWLLPADRAPARVAAAADTFRAGAERCRWVGEEPALLLERVAEPRHPVFLFGAGHVGRALLPILAALPLRVTVVESRPEMLPPAVPAGITVLPSSAPALEIDDVPDGAAVIVMTHDHALDLEIVAAALARPGIAFVGLIGSATKRARFVSRLKARGFGTETVARLVCPIGIAGIEGKDPAIIAVSTAAQILLACEERATAGGR